jgi:putative flippase GtrA
MSLEWSIVRFGIVGILATIVHTALFSVFGRRCGVLLGKSPMDFQAAFSTGIGICKICTIRQFGIYPE